MIKRETLALVFFCEFCEIFKSIYFYKTPPMAASEPAQSFRAIFLTSNLSRSSHQRCSLEKAVFKNFAIFTGKHLLESLFIKVALQRRCFPVNIAKFNFKSTYFEEHLRTAAFVYLWFAATLVIVTKTNLFENTFTY